MSEILKEREKEVEILEKMTKFLKQHEGRVYPASMLLKSIILLANGLTGGDCKYKMDVDTAVVLDDYIVNHVTVHSRAALDEIECKANDKVVKFAIDVERSMIGTEKGAELLVMERVKKVELI